MKTAIIGPVCKDEIIINGASYFKPGGVTYYAGQALHKLGAEVTIFGSYGEGEDVSFFDCKVIRVAGEGTMRFINEYGFNPNNRVQRAIVPNNEIKLDDLVDYDLDNFDFLILGPLFNDNISPDLIKNLVDYKPKKVLAAQGMIRYLDDDRIVLKNPERVTEALRYIDYLFLDEHELIFISSAGGVNHLKSYGVENIIVTNGYNGSKLYLDSKVIKIISFPPRELVDPTGAGDSYMAGYLYSINGEFAAMTATINLESEGAFNRDKDYVLKRLIEEKS